jgi:hypothetical protein
MSSEPPRSNSNLHTTPPFGSSAGTDGRVDASTDENRKNASFETDDHSPLRENAPTTYYDDLVKIPGMGEAPNRCRDLQPVGFCEAGHTVLGRSSCGTRYCPTHWRDWAEDAVSPILRRLAAYRHVQSGAGRRLVHVVASPPQSRRYSVREFWETRSDAYDALEDAGVRGGVSMSHPYRTNAVGDDLYQAAIDGGEIEPDYGRWRFLREAADDWDDLSRYIEASPHYHSLAAARDVRGDHAPEGWVVENVRSMSRWDIDDPECYEEMAGTAYYLLTHGGVGGDEKERSTTTYFGEMHPAVFDPEEELADEELAKIDELVAQVVGLEEEGEGHGPEECPCDDCEAAVRDLIYLDEFLDDEEWCDRVRDHVDGGTRLATLRGTHAYIKGLTDRPPPSAQTNSDEFRRWLKREGQIAAGRSNRPAQTVQNTFDPSVVWSLSE